MPEKAVWHTEKDFWRGMATVTFVTNMHENLNHNVKKAMCILLPELKEILPSCLLPCSPATHYGMKETRKQTGRNNVNGRRQKSSDHNYLCIQ
jgi:hypothetical protein